MAWHIVFFLKSLRILEEFRNNPCVKIPPKSPCANFQSLGKFKKSKFYSERIFQLPAQSAQQPAGPLSLLTHPALSTSLFLLRMHQPSAASSSHVAEPRPPHRTSPMPSNGANRSSPSLPPFTRSHFLPLHHSGNDSIEDAIYHCHPAYPGHLRLPPSPIKGYEHPRLSPPLFPSLMSSLAPSVTLTLSSGPHHSSPPSHCLSTAARAPVRAEPGSPCSPLSIVPPPVSSRAPEWPRGQAPMSCHRPVLLCSP
jgi:hypothetical protein